MTQAQTEHVIRLLECISATLIKIEAALDVDKAERIERRREARRASKLGDKSGG